MITQEMIDNSNDYELLMLYRENDEDAKNILYLKYKFIIDVLINKHIKVIKFLNIDLQEVYSECTIGFCNALNSYQDDKNTQLATFISLCIERNLKRLIKRYGTKKSKIIAETFSLEYLYNFFQRPLMDLLEDTTHEPLSNIINEEKFIELNNRIDKVLSSHEKEVFELLIDNFNYRQIAKILKKTPKQIDNTIQRIKNKVRQIIKEFKICNEEI